MSGLERPMTARSRRGSGFGYGNGMAGAVRNAAAMLAHNFLGTATIALRSPPVAVTLKITCSRSAGNVTRTRLRVTLRRRRAAPASVQKLQELESRAPSRHGAGSMGRL